MGRRRNTIQVPTRARKNEAETFSYVTSTGKEVQVVNEFDDSKLLVMGVPMWARHSITKSIEEEMRVRYPTPESLPAETRKAWLVLVIASVLQHLVERGTIIWGVLGRTHLRNTKNRRFDLMDHVWEKFPYPMLHFLDVPRAIRELKKEMEEKVKALGVFLPVQTLHMRILRDLTRALGQPVTSEDEASWLSAITGSKEIILKDGKTRYSTKVLHGVGEFYGLLKAKRTPQQYGVVVDPPTLLRFLEWCQRGSNDIQFLAWMKGRYMVRGDWGVDVCKK